MSDLIISPNSDLVQLNNDQPAVISRDIALRFQKKHKHILEEIKRIQSIVPKDFYGPNFRPVNYTDAKGEERPAFLLSRDAFSLLAMGFTGKAAIAWKLKYIEAFNALEKAVLENTRQAALQEGVRLRNRLTPERRKLMRKAVAYKKRGFSHREIGKMLDCSHTLAQNLLKDAALVGMEA